MRRSPLPTTRVMCCRSSPTRSSSRRPARLSATRAPMPPSSRCSACLVEGLGFESPLAVGHFDDITAIDELAGIADVFIVDLGVDVVSGRGFTRRGRQERAPPVSSQPRAAVHRARSPDRRRAGTHRPRRASAPVRARQQLDGAVGCLRPHPVRLQLHDDSFPRAARDRQGRCRHRRDRRRTHTRPPSDALEHAARVRGSARPPAPRGDGRLRRPLRLRRIRGGLGVSGRHRHLD